MTPSILIGLILAFLPTYLIRWKIFGIPTTALEIMLLVFFLVAMLRITNQDIQKLRKLGLINWAILLFLLAGAISVLISPEQVKALGQLKAFIVEPIIFFYLSILWLKTDQDRKVALRWLFAGSVVVSLFGLLQYVTYIHLPLRFWGTGSEVERITSVFEYPNALALYLAPLFVFFLTLQTKGFDLFKKQWVMALGLIIMAASLALTFSRGAWLAVIISVLVLSLRRYPWKKTLSIILLTLVLIFLVKPISGRLGLGLNDASSQVHRDLIKIGVQQVIASPILGNGLHGFHALDVDYPHNILLNFWLEMGLLGLLSFGLIIQAVGERYKKSANTLSLAAGMFLLVVVLHGLVDVPYFKNDLAILFWFMVSLFYVHT